MNQKHVFWEALILAAFIFASGILVGYFIELNRTSQIITSYQQAEINLLDVQIQQEIFSLGEFNCKTAIEETIDFADHIYREAQLLEKYEESSRLSDGILYQHQKYALLRTVLFTNVLKLNEKCSNVPDSVIYFYEFNSKEVNIESKQEAFSRYLIELKQEYGNEVILIPIAGSLDVNSIELLKSNYNIEELPSILVNEGNLITEIEDLETIRNYLN